MPLITMWVRMMLTASRQVLWLTFCEYVGGRYEVGEQI